MTSAHSAASATFLSTVKPASSALAIDFEPSLRPTTDLDAGVAQVQRVGVALGAVADDGNLAALDDRQVGVVVVEHFSHLGNSF